MFGYITADHSQMDDADFRRYSGCYCGLCRVLQKRHGFSGRMTLTYDMAFLVLVLTSLYEPEETREKERCPVHPFKRHDYWTSKYTDYAADLNVLLAWWNCMDDWQDEKKVSRLALAKLLGSQVQELEQKYPRQSQAIQAQLSRLHRYATGPETSADAAANCFGDLKGELFVVNESD